MRTCILILILSWAFLGACKEGKLKLSVEKEDGKTVIALKTQANRLEGKWECTASSSTFSETTTMEFLPNLHINSKGKITFKPQGKSFAFEATASFEIKKERLCTVTTKFNSKALFLDPLNRNKVIERDNAPGSSECIDIVKHTKSKLVLGGEYKTTCTR